MASPFGRSLMHPLREPVRHALLAPRRVPGATLLPPSGHLRLKGHDTAGLSLPLKGYGQAGNSINLFGKASSMAEGQLRLFVPEASDASIRAAALEAIELGGGRIALADGEIALTAPLPVASGLHYIGTPPVITFGAGIPDSDWTVSGGTRLIGDGSFAAFAGNHEPTGSPPADFTAAISNFGLEDVAFSNFSRAVDIGARNVMGLMYSRLSNLFVEDCSDWAVNLENFMHSAVERIFVRTSARGQRYAATLPAATLLPGNSRFHTLFVVTNHSTIGRKARGIVFEADGGVLNQMFVDRLQCNRFYGSGETELVEGVTLVGGSADIAVADGDDYAVGMPVSFQASAGGFAADVAYFVRSIAGDTITVGGAHGGPAIAASGSGPATIRSQGFPALEVLGLNGGKVLNGMFHGLDLEGRGSISMLCENVETCQFAPSETDNSLPYNNFVLRNSPLNLITYFNPSASSDFDDNSSSTAYYGSRGRIRRSPGVGLWADGTRGGLCSLNLHGSSHGNGADLMLRSNNKFFYPSVGFGTHVTDKWDNAVLDPIDAGLMTFTGSTNSTFTLPVITDVSDTSSLVGLTFEIANAGTANLAVASSGAQLFNRVAGKTAYALTPGQALKVVANRALDNTLFWAAFPGAGVS